MGKVAALTVLIETWCAARMKSLDWRQRWRHCDCTHATWVFISRIVCNKVTAKNAQAVHNDHWPENDGLPTSGYYYFQYVNHDERVPINNYCEIICIVDLFVCTVVLGHFMIVSSRILACSNQGIISPTNQLSYARSAHRQKISTRFSPVVVFCCVHGYILKILVTVSWEPVRRILYTMIRDSGWHLCKVSTLQINFRKMDRWHFFFVWIGLALEHDQFISSPSLL